MTVDGQPLAPVLLGWIPAGATTATVDLAMDRALYSVTAYVLALTSKAPQCGDGELDPGEECDDGNTIPGDGCTDCQLCDVLGIAPLQVLAVKSADHADVVLHYDRDGSAEAYNSWFVTAKADIPCARHSGCGSNPPGCGPAAEATCAHAGAVAYVPPDRVYYDQVRGVCNGEEAIE